MRSAALLLTLALAATASPAAAPQTAKSAQSKNDEIPPLSYTCTMHPEQVTDKPGKCPVCQMDLVPIRLDSVWTCSAKPLAVVRSEAGRCPIDGTPLVQVTASVVWTCQNPTTTNVNPGICPDGTLREKKYEPFAHGNHNPQHGGLFFMAPDNWHHIEGALPRSGVFRAYLYDQYTKPLKAADFKQIKGRVITKQTFDPATKKTTEIESFPLVAVAGGKYYTANIGKTTLPAPMTARVKFTPDGKEYQFDFTFEKYTKDPVTATATPTTTNAAATTTAAPPAAKPAATKPAATAAPAPVASTPAPSLSADAGSVDPALIQLPIPDTVPEMLAQLKTRTDQIRGLIDRGAYGSIYVPAFQAKDLALAIDENRKDLTADRQRIVEPAVAKLVRSAWLLDAFGDLGNKLQISEAFTSFVEASKDIQDSFPNHP
jgi:Heavy metal binding domain